MGKAAREAARAARRAQVELTRAQEAADRSEADHPLNRLVNAPTPLASLHAIRDVRDWIDELEAGYVGQLRDSGVPWAVLGKALGVSGQAVSKRYGRRT